MQASVQKEIKIEMIQTECRETKEFSICYTLYRIVSQCSDYFAREVSSGEESDMQMLGKSNERAQRIFEIFVNETVTPCTLSEIICDIIMEEEEKKHRQNLCKI